MKVVLLRPSAQVLVVALLLLALGGCTCIETENGERNCVELLVQ